MKSHLALSRKPPSLSENLIFLRDLKRKYRSLYREEVKPLPDGTFAFHHGRLARREGINVLFLRGDSFEMMFQHGRLLREAIHRGVLHELHRMIPNIIHNSVTRNPLLGRAIARGTDFWGSSVLLNNVSQEDLKDTFALSEGAQLPLEKISGAMLCVEALTILAKYAVKSKGIHVHPMAFSGCSSFAAWGRHTANGELIVGRNLDYQLNGFFDAHPTVAYHEPTDGTQSYVSIGSAGIHTPSLTAFNQSGVYLAVHMTPTAESSFSGTPAFFVSSEVIKKARTFDEAVAIFRRSRPSAGWAFVLVSFREKRVASVEITHDRMAVREAEGTFHGQTNHYLDPEMESANLYINRSINRDSAGRLSRLEQLAAEMKTIDARAAQKILADNWDPFEKRPRGLGATIAVHITVGSSIFCPAEGKFYLANGMAPTSQNDYIAFPWLGQEDAETFVQTPYDKLSGKEFSSRHPREAEAVQHYIAAKVAYENHSDVQGAYELMGKVVALDPGNAAYRFVRAIFAVKIGRVDEAAHALGEVLAMDHTRQLHQLSHYYLGRLYALQGRGEEALAELGTVLNDLSADEKLIRAARKASWRTRLLGRCPFPTEHLPLLMQFADFLSY